jgi:hypothetical protein
MDHHSQHHLKDSIKRLIQEEEDAGLLYVEAFREAVEGLGEHAKDFSEFVIKWFEGQERA